MLGSVTAFMETFKDPEFVAEAKKSDLDIAPIGGEEIAKTVENLSKIEAPAAEGLKKILVPK